MISRWIFSLNTHSCFYYLATVERFVSLATTDWNGIYMKRHRFIGLVQRHRLMCAQPIWNIFFFKYSKVIKYSHLRLIWWLLYDFFSFGYMRASSSIIFWYSGNRKKTENDKLTKGAKKFSHQTIFRLFIYTCIIENDFVVVTKHDYVFRPSHCSTLENPRDPPPPRRATVIETFRTAVHLWRTYNYVHYNLHVHSSNVRVRDDWLR